MKKISILMIFLMIFFTKSGLCSTSVRVLYNNKEITCDVSPYIENSRTLIPVRMTEQLGYSVSWNDSSRTVSLAKSGTSIKLTIDSSTAYVNGTSVKMDVPAKITSDRTFVPIRFVAENFGYNVNWDSSSRTVLITDPSDLSVTDITAEKTASALLVKVFSSSVMSDVKTMVLENPKRYIYDIQNAVLTTPVSEIAVNSGIIKAVRYSQFSVSPNTVRVVVELKKDTEVSAGYENGIYTITVADGEVPTVTSLSIVSGDNTASVYMRTDMTLNYKSYKLSNPSRYVLELPDSDIAAPDVTGDGNVVNSAKLTRSGGVTTLTVYLAGAVSATKCSVSQNGNEFTITVNKTSDTPTVNNGFLIVIDPGHGGDEPGSLGKINGETVLYEKDVNLQIGKKVYEKLLERGYNVIATRTEDVTVSLAQRVEIANTSGADLFVSVHNNSFTDSSAKGTLTMYAYSEPKSGMSFSGKQVASIIQPYLASATGSQDRKLMENSKIYVTAKTNMPAVLCECLFMSNPEDLAKLMNPSYIESIAEGIANGIEAAVKQMQ